MKLNSVWTSIIYFFDAVTFQTTDVTELPAVQKPIDSVSEPIVAHLDHPHVKPLDAHVISLNTEAIDDGKPYVLEDGTPIVPTPKNDQEGSNRVNCEYPEEKGFVNCNSHDDRQCWLVNRKTGKKFDVNTDYEDEDEVPRGITRKFYLEVGEQPIWPDKVTMEHGKVFNRTYPGPWIEACWGDTIEVTVKNTLRWNGTSIHWHGFRQLRTNHEDGVNGVTECPIAPGDTYTYKFRALQYGSAWYHSHYGLQYGDGTLGPITIYGPSTANYGSDLAFRPILMTDWNHRSVFEDWPSELVSGNAPQMTNILLNGTGQFGPGSTIDDKYQIHFEAGKRHKLILINTSVDTIFVFSIDHHEFEVMEMDFVPIKPYTTKYIKIGIGQRYHIVVTGHKDPYIKERDANYFIRTQPARKCNKFAYGPDEESGIIRYNKTELRNVSSLTEPDGYIDISCGDEDMKNLIPWKGWQVEDPVNIDPRQKNIDAIPKEKRYIFDVAMHPSEGKPYYPEDWRLRWSMHTSPFRINFSDPTIFHMEDTSKIIDQPYLDVVTYGKDVEDEWIWMVITASAIPVGGGERTFFPAAHPMHLHGHDFAVLYQTDYPWYDDFGGHKPKTGFYREFGPDKLNCANPRLNCNNPTRRDVIMLPAGGFVIIAFKADNPGAWIFHCHIAFHASSGLAMQIIENKHLIKDNTTPEDNKKIKDRCDNWHKWFNDPMNHWNWQHPEDFQDDSGV